MNIEEAQSALKNKESEEILKQWYDQNDTSDAYAQFNDLPTTKELLQKQIT